MENQQDRTRLLEENEISSLGEGAAQSDPGWRLYPSAGNLLDASLKGVCHVMFVYWPYLVLGGRQPRDAETVWFMLVLGSKCVKIKRRKKKSPWLTCMLIFIIMLALALGSSFNAAALYRFSLSGIFTSTHFSNSFFQSTFKLIPPSMPLCSSLSPRRLWTSWAKFSDLWLHCILDL